MSENFKDLCERYIDALDSEIDEEQLDELEEEIAELEEERDQFVKDYGEDDVLVERVEDDIAELMDEQEEIEGAFDQVEELETDILEMISSEFIAEDSYLTETSIEAMNHIFTDGRAPELLIEDWVVTPEIELDSNVRTITDYIRKLALAKLERDDSIRKTWSGIEGGKRLDPFLTVARADTPLTPSEVAERIGDGMERQTAGNRLRDAIHHSDYSPYHRVDGGYTLSTVGKLIARQYAGEGVLTPSQEEIEELETEPDGQTRLNEAGDEDD